MIASELRVGNWVSKDGEIYQATSATITALENDYFKVEPVVIDSDWLKKFGFESLRKNYSLNMGRELFEYAVKYDTEFVVYYDNRNQGWTLDESVKPDRTHFIFSIHELQNLHYALTGKELVIKTNQSNEI